MNTTTFPDSQEQVTPTPATESGPVVGVRTTKIYCRLVCRPGRTASRENCVPFLNTAAARAAGYRACKQCRPDDTEAPARVNRPPRETPRAIRYGVGQTPLGFTFVATTDRGVLALYPQTSSDPSPALELVRRDFPCATIEPDRADADRVIGRVVDNLTQGTPCDDVGVDLRGTPFQLRVWEGLRSIPRGQTRTYGRLAVDLGLPAGSARAVGTACGANRVMLLVPCHRVVRAGGGLGGFYWGLDVKRALLEMEGVYPEGP